MSILLYTDFFCVKWCINDTWTIIITKMNLSYIYIIYEDYTCMQKVDKDIDSHKMQRSPPSDGKEQSQKKVIY